MQDLLQPCMQQILSRKKKKKNKKQKTLPFSIIVIVSHSTNTIPNTGVGNDGCYIKLVM